MSAVSPDLQWCDQYRVGEPDVDTQHQQLFELFSRLTQALEACRGPKVIGASLNELIAYARHHFADEERMKGRLRYPQLVPRQRQHRQLLRQVEAVREEYEEVKPVLTIELIQFLRRWLEDHILDADMKIRDHRFHVES